MNEQISQTEVHDGEPRQGERVVYVRRAPAWQRMGQRWRERSRWWLEHSVDAPLPESVRQKLPAGIDSTWGRIGLGLGAVLMVAVWALVLWLWVL